MSLDGHSYEYVDPHGGQSSRVDVPMRVFSGPYYQNLFNLLEYLEISSVERRFLFAFADDVATISRYYFFHGSNNHRSPMICRRSPGVFGILSALWTFFTVLYCYVWFSIACFWIPPKVGPMPEKTETIGQYLTRLRLPEFFIHGYIIPLFSGVASSPHELFLKFPAVYLADYKRQTHMFHHRTLNDMALLQRRLTQGISLVYYAKVIKVERYNGRLKLHYQNTRSGEAVGAIFNRVILAVNPEQISAIYPPTKYVMDGLQTCDVSVVIHQDYKILPEESTELVRDSRSELMAIHVKDIDAAGKATVATHAHPCGVLVTVWSGKSLLVDIDPKKVLHESNFIRVLTTPTSRQNLSAMFQGGPRSWSMAMMVFTFAGAGLGMALLFWRAVSGAVSLPHGPSGRSCHLR